MVTSPGIVIRYSDTYCDDQYEYRHVVVPLEMVKVIRKVCGGNQRLMEQHEWSQILAQHRSWEHYSIHRPEPHVLLFRRPKNYIEHRSMSPDLEGENEIDDFDEKQTNESFASKLPDIKRKSLLLEQRTSNDISNISQEGETNRYIFTADNTTKQQYSPTHERILLLAPSKRSRKTTSFSSSPKRLDFGSASADDTDVTSSDNSNIRKHRRIRRSAPSVSSLLNGTAQSAVVPMSHETLSVTTL